MPPRAATVTVTALAAAVLGTLAVRHPDLRFVDVIGFSERARGLPEGRELTSGLYPVGYPALLWLGKHLTGDVLVAAKALSVAGGTAAVAASAALFGPVVAVWLLAQLSVLEYGATEGTDMPATALALASLAAAHGRRPGLAGALFGAACMTRYTALAALPALVLLGGLRVRGIAAVAAVTLPHWALAAWTGGSPWPDQGSNVAMVAVAGSPWARWLPGMGRALADAAAEWPVRIAALGLLVGLARRDRRALALVAWGLAHAAGVALLFSNARLVLPATVCAALGAAWLVPRGAWLALPALLVGAWNAPRAWAPRPQETTLAAIVGATRGLEGPFLSTSAWFYARDGGWLSRPILLGALGLRLQAAPDNVLEAARRTGARHFVMDQGRVARNHPGLRALYKTGEAEGFTLVAEAPGWRVMRVE